MLITLTIWLRGTGYRSGEFSVPSGGVGEDLDAVVGEGHQPRERCRRPYHGGQPRCVQFRLSRLVRLRIGDVEDTVAFNLSIPGTVQWSSPLEMESSGG